MVTVIGEQPYLENELSNFTVAVIKDYQIVYQVVRKYKLHAIDIYSKPDI